MRSATLSEKEVRNLISEMDIHKLTKITVKNPHELLRVKEGEIFFVLHNTKKLVFQETEAMEDVLDNILIKPECTVIGTDEAGKGEWYGPLVVAGVALTPDEALKLRKMGIGDSKELSSGRIEELGEFIKKSGIEREVRVLHPGRYNTLYEEFKKEGKNLNDILSWAHTGVIHDLLSRIQPEKVKVVIDKFDVGGKAITTRITKLKKFNVSILEETGAESEPAVAAASVLAKSIFEYSIHEINETFDIDVRNTSPEDITREILPEVAKLHFKNVV
jgi:ribonuclease HIII